VETESVADHSFRVAVMAWLLAGDGLDRDRVLKLALLHDLAEAATDSVSTPGTPRSSQPVRGVSFSRPTVRKNSANAFARRSCFVISSPGARLSHIAFANVGEDTGRRRRAVVVWCCTTSYIGNRGSSRR
jgi:hypothetical protein